jgi:hypothetical protein
MRLWLISFFILTGCGRPEDPALDIVRLPQTAYGPFDAAAVRVVAASDAGSDAEPKAPAAQIDCYVPDEPPEEKVAPAPFDNCPLQWDSGHFNDKATSQRRARNREICCYTVVRRKRNVIQLREVE